MKKFSIILNIVLVLVTLFFVVYARIQTSLAAELNALATSNAEEARKITELAERSAADALESQAKALEAQVQLEICQNSK